MLLLSRAFSYISALFLTLFAFRSAASGAPQECFRLVNLHAGSVIATVEVSAGMYPPTHMTSIYPPPQITRDRVREELPCLAAGMYPPPHMTFMYPPAGWQCNSQFCGQLLVRIRERGPIC